MRAPVHPQGPVLKVTTTTTIIWFGKAKWRTSIGLCSIPKPLNTFSCPWNAKESCDYGLRHITMIKWTQTSCSWGKKLCAYEFILKMPLFCKISHLWKKNVGEEKGVWVHLGRIMLKLFLFIEWKALNPSDPSWQFSSGSRGVCHLLLERGGAHSGGWRATMHKVVSALRALWWWCGACLYSYS